MNKPIDQSEFQTPEVTSGALPSSSKVYTAPDADPTPARAASFGAFAPIGK